MTPYSAYGKNLDPNKGTLKEILWLLDNQYTYEIDPNTEETTFLPPFRHMAQKIINDYRMLSQNEYSQQKKRLIALFDDLKKQLEQKKNIITDNKIYCKNKFYFSVKNSVENINLDKNTYRYTPSK